MNGESFNKKILEKIEDIKPTPKWYFILRDGSFLLAYIISIIVGALAFGALIFTFSHIGWKYYGLTHGNIFTFTVATLPYIWLCTILAIIVISHLAFRHTKKGYRRKTITVIGASVISSALIGTVLYMNGVGRIIENDYGRNIPFHEPVFMYENMIWNNPWKGLIAGSVTKIDKENEIIELKEFNGSTTIILSGEYLSDKDWETASSSEDVRVMVLPIISSTTSSSTIFVTNLASSASTTFRIACRILPWEIPQPSFFMKLQQKEIREKSGNGNAQKNRFGTNKREIFIGGQSNNLCKDVRPY